MKLRLVKVVFAGIFACTVLFAGCSASAGTGAPSAGESAKAESEEPSAAVSTVSFIAGMGCSDETCTDPAHHHDCPADCADYEHHHHCGLDCTDASHHHAEHHEDSHHEDAHHS